MIQREVLPNGVRIVTENITYVQSVALGIWVGVGARDEGDEVRGGEYERQAAVID